MSFGKRLEAIGAMVPKCEHFVDVGTDHAYLPVLLAQAKKVGHAIATDIVPGPCDAARKTVEEFGLQNIIEVRQADGLTGCAPEEAETVAIAGMGAATMLHILAASPSVTRAINTLILQPMNESEALRRWAAAEGWGIVAEDLVEEGGKIYEILRLNDSSSARSGGTQTSLGPCYQVGAYLVEHHHPLLHKHVADLIEKYTSLLIAMEVSPRAVGSDKYKEFQLIKRQLEEINNEENNRS